MQEKIHKQPIFLAITVAAQKYIDFNKYLQFSSSLEFCKLVEILKYFDLKISCMGRW